MNYKVVSIILLAIFIGGPLSAQGKNRKKVVLEGRIVNRDTIPVSNVTILLDGINTNIVSNAKGEFRLRFKPDVKKITFYCVETGIFEVDYTGQKRLEIIMNHESSSLFIDPSTTSKTVDVGYGRISEDDIVGSVTTVKQDKSDNRIYKDIYEMIIEKVPGVTYDGGSIKIRGDGSLMGSNTPLFVVDGAQVSSVSNIPPTDVESINILKGSSAAIYGSRGANGVIIINTKRGSRTKK